MYGPILGRGSAAMTYDIDGSTAHTVDGNAETNVWYEDPNTPTAATVTLTFGQIFFAFAISPFSGTGTCQGLWLVRFRDPSMYPGVPGFYTDVAVPPAPDPPPPVLTVNEFKLTGAVTYWSLLLQAHLVWYNTMSSVTEPPMALNVATLTMQTQKSGSSAQPQSGSFADVGAEQFSSWAAASGIDIQASQVIAQHARRARM